MTDLPKFDVADDTETDVQRVRWLREIFDAADRYVNEAEAPPPEIGYWPRAIEKIAHTPEIMTVYWDDGLSICCFRWAFDKAWKDLGDGTPVQHVSMDDVHDEACASAR